jgi:GH15 family glucan-1,4-alpha-glucosidase
MYAEIRDYAIIGNTVSAALVGADASIDWACLPRFDSPACFLRLLDDEKGGYCSLGLHGLLDSTREYIDNTNLLVTTMHAPTGQLTVTDFMPVRRLEKNSGNGRESEAKPRIIRYLQCPQGSIEAEASIFPTLNYAGQKQNVSHASGLWKYSSGDDSLYVQCSGQVQPAGERLLSHIRLKAGESAFIVLTHSSEEAPEPLSLATVQKSLDETRHYWEEWVKTCSYRGKHRAVVVRSALALKLLVYEQTGAIVAAPTSSLPEWIGGERNWDYRYTWLRDSSLTLVALMNLGYFGEARDFLRFLRRSLPASAADFQVMYTVAGETDVTEKELHHLSGFKHSSPVRVGNGAAHQTQLDIFGELAHCVYLYWTHPGFDHTGEDFRQDEWPLVHACAEFVAQHWSQPGSGIWEMRGPAKQGTHSKAMCFVTLDRALKLAERFQVHSSDLQSWREQKDKIFADFTSSGYNPRLPGYAQSYGSDAADAALLRLPLFGVISAQDERMRQTIASIERQLKKNGLLYRYRNTPDGLHGEEGTFTACSYWLVENYALQQRYQEAESLFEYVTSFANDLDLMSEEINPDNGSMLGNFPQGFTHIALINAAVRMAAAEHDAQSLSHSILRGTSSD